VLVSHGVVHTFENAANSEARFSEVVAPGAFAGYFEELIAAPLAGGWPPDPATVTSLYEKYDIVPAPQRETEQRRISQKTGGRTPVGAGIPISSPKCVPRNVARTATLSS